MVFRNFHLLLSTLLLCLLLQSCRSPWSIRPEGLRNLQLSSQMPGAEDQRFQGYQVSDTVLREEGYEWQTLIIHHAQGNVWVEADFFKGEVINRLRIETPEFHVKKKIRVGNVWKELQPMAAGWNLTYLPTHQRIDAYSSEFPGIHFLFPTKEAPNPSEALSINSIPQDAEIVAIVVM
ncbi:MAG: hypothetical protein AAGI38_11745 [Bacteroidota bacterium]